MMGQGYLHAAEGGLLLDAEGGQSVVLGTPAEGGLQAAEQSS